MDLGTTKKKHVCFNCNILLVQARSRGSGKEDTDTATTSSERADSRRQSEQAHAAEDGGSEASPSEAASSRSASSQHSEVEKATPPVQDAPALGPVTATSTVEPHEVYEDGSKQTHFGRINWGLVKYHSRSKSKPAEVQDQNCLQRIPA